MKESNIQLDIQNLLPDGTGSGTFTDGAGNVKVAEVPYTAPGDLVECTIKRKRSGVYPGKLLQVLRPSTERIEAKCIHFGECGGCALQHIPYELQLKYKEEVVRSYFRNFPEVKSNKILACEKPWGYRNKMEFSFSEDLAGNQYLGLFKAFGKGRVLNLTECHLTSKWFIEILEKVRVWWKGSGLKAYHPMSNKGSLRTLTVRESATTGEHLVMLTVSGVPEYAMKKEQLESFKTLFELDCSVFLRIHQAIKGKPTEFFEMHLAGPEMIFEDLGIKFGISPSAFFQPNTSQAKRLYQKALSLAGLSKDDVVYDLYCGTGTMGLLAAPLVKFVLGVELSPESSLDGRENAKRNNIGNIEIVTGKVEEVLQDTSKYPPPTVILVDPPRSGLDRRAIEEILRLKAPKVVYISCNPKTQGKDVELLVQGGYRLKELQPVDQFPQTPHIENIAYLTTV